MHSPFCVSPVYGSLKPQRFAWAIGCESNEEHDHTYVASERVGSDDLVLCNGQSLHL